MKKAVNGPWKYYKRFLSQDESTSLFNYLINISELIQQHQSTTLTDETHEHDFGKLMFINTEEHNQNIFPFSIWGHTRIWSPTMLNLKDKVEKYTSQKFGVCVCIYYPDGHSGIVYHSDLPAYGDTNFIASLSLGEERLFKFREKETQNETSMILHHGSLLIMAEKCQDQFEHSLPFDAKYKNPRINLTFRKFGYS